MQHKGSSSPQCSSNAASPLVLYHSSSSSSSPPPESFPSSIYRYLMSFHCLCTLRQSFVPLYAAALARTPRFIVSHILVEIESKALRTVSRASNSQYPRASSYISVANAPTNIVPKNTAFLLTKVLQRWSATSNGSLPALRVNVRVEGIEDARHGRQ